MFALLYYDELSTAILVSPLNILVFEDKQVPLLHPVTTGRPAYSITCGSYRLIDWLRSFGGKISALTRDHLAASQLLDFSDVGEPDATEPWTLLVNARMVPSLTNFDLLKRLGNTATSNIVRADWSIAAAMMPTDQVPVDLNSFELTVIEDFFASRSIAPANLNFDLIEHPHDIVRAHLKCFPENLQHRIDNGNFSQRSDGLFVSDTATVGEGLVVDTSQGPIVLDDNVAVGPHCFMSGPVYVGPNSRIIEQSSIKDKVCLGHTTKIGGEVEASIIEAYSNKQHHGFLGHSYLGSWINLGAGTCNSDLKNTYGEVKMEYAGQKVSTGMQFIGCIMGDYSKSAINTGIFTGKVIGTCSMLYGFVTTNVPSFVNYARSFGQVTEMPPSVMASTQRRMFQRRDVEQRPCDVQLLTDMYDLTRHERQLAEEPLVL